MVASLPTRAKTVGSTNQPRSHCAGRPPPVASLAPSLLTAIVRRRRVCILSSQPTDSHPWSDDISPVLTSDVKTGQEREFFSPQEDRIEGRSDMPRLALNQRVAPKPLISLALRGETFSHPPDQAGCGAAPKRTGYPRKTGQCPRKVRMAPPRRQDNAPGKTG